MYTNGTTNYNLPQYVDSDKATWTDLNAPFNAIDAAIKGAVDNTAQEALDIDALEARMDAAELNIGTNTTNISGLDTRLTTAEGSITAQGAQIADVKNDTEDMICAYNEASATSTHAYEIGDYFIYNDVLYRATQQIAIGDTIVPDTNCTTTNVTTELLNIDDLSEDVAQLQTDVGQLQTDLDGKEDKAVETITSSAQTTFVGLANELFNSINSGYTNEQIERSTLKILSLELTIDEVSDTMIKAHAAFATTAGDNLRIYAFKFDRAAGTTSSFAGGVTLSTGIPETVPSGASYTVII